MHQDRVRKYEADLNQFDAEREKLVAQKETNKSEIESLRQQLKIHDVIVKIDQWEVNDPTQVDFDPFGFHLLWRDDAVVPVFGSLLQL